MKKIILLLIGLILVAGCTNNSIKTITNEEKTTDEEFKDPKLEWCQLYNPNGFETITCVVSNPNDVDIDITYDMVFYKAGQEVARQSEWSNYQISPKHNDVIWANVGIPKASDVDEIKMENITVTKAYNKSIDADIKYVETIGNQAYFSVESKNKPTLNTIWFFLYNDKNNNKKCDQGELIITDVESVLEQDTEISIDTDVSGSKYGIDYNSYEIYYNAY